jgi:hypothetical protein
MTTFATKRSVRARQGGDPSEPPGISSSDRRELN